MSATDLSKMGIAHVALNVSDFGHTVIEKYPVGEVEYRFYQDVATELNQAGIATPKLFSADASMRMLRMEYIPHKVEQNDVADDEAIIMLGRLHCFPANSDWRYHTHLWSERALENNTSHLIQKISKLNSGRSLSPPTPNESEVSGRQFW